MLELQYASFMVGLGWFAIELPLIKEIHQLPEATPAPLAGAFVHGLINLRGQVVTVLDPAVPLGIDAPPAGPESHIIVLKRSEDIARLKLPPGCQPWHGNPDLLALLATSIGDVIDPHVDKPEPPPANLPAGELPYIHGVIPEEHQLVAVLELSNLLDASGVQSETPQGVPSAGV